MELDSLTRFIGKRTSRRFLAAFYAACLVSACIFVRWINVPFVQDQYNDVGYYCRAIDRLVSEWDPPETLLATKVEHPHNPIGHNPVPAKPVFVGLAVLYARLHQAIWPSFSETDLNVEALKAELDKDTKTNNFIKLQLNLAGGRANDVTRERLLEALNMVLMRRDFFTNHLEVAQSSLRPCTARMLSEAKSTLANGRKLGGLERNLLNRFLLQDTYQDGLRPSRDLSRIFFSFVLVTFFVLIAAVFAVGSKVFGMHAGFAAAMATAISPWMGIALFFPNYNFLAALFLLMCVWLLLCRRGFPSAFLSGIFALLLVYTSNAGIIYLPGLAIVFLVVSGSLKEKIKRAALAVSGGLLPLLLAELAVHAWIRLPHSPGILIYGPLRSLVAYYQYSATQNHLAILHGHTEVPKYLLMEFLILSKESMVGVGLIALAFCLALRSVLMKGWSGLDEAVRYSTVFLLFVLLGWGLIDFRPGGLQLGRFYTLGYPILMLGVSHGLIEASKKSRILAVSILLLAAGHVKIAQARLAERRLTTSALVDFVNTLPPREPIYIVSPVNGNASAMLRVLRDVVAKDRVETRCPTLDCVEGDMAENGPVTLLFPPSVIKNVLGPGIPRADAFPKSLQVLSRQKIPFYGSYPLLIFEDEGVTWDYISKIYPTRDIWKTGVGAIEAVRASFSSVLAPRPFGSPLEASRASASSRHPTYGPDLLIDGGLRKIDGVSAWHSSSRPPFPQRVELELASPSPVRFIGLQPQEGHSSLAERFPRLLEIQGIDVDGRLVNFGGFEIEGVPRTGRYRFIELPENSVPLRSLAMIIKDNFSDKDWITIEEITLYDK